MSAQTARVCSKIRIKPELAPFFLDLDGHPDQAAPPLTEVVHLADQLEDAGSPASSVPDTASAASRVAEAGSPASALIESTRS